MRLPLIAVLGPFLAGLYLPLAVAANVGGELFRLRDLPAPLAVSVGVSVACWGVGYWLGRSPFKAALVSITGQVAFSSLGWVVATLGSTGAHQAVRGEVSVVLLFAVAVSGMTVAVARSRRPLVEPVRFLTFMYIFLVIYVAGKTGWSLQRAGQVPAAPVPAEISAPATTAVLPDIYLIVLDKYTGSGALAREYGFDNAGVESELRSRGFVVPGRARSNYVHTFLSLASMLNLRYLDDLPERFGPDNGRWELTYPLIENSRLATFLRSRGYRFVFLPSAFGATRQNRYADLQIPHPADVRPELLAAWRHLTAVPVLQSLACRVLECVIDRPPYLPSGAAVVDSEFAALELMSKTQPPVFVVAHLLVPHEPYLYSADCAHRVAYWPLRDDGPDSAQVRQAYLDQIRCVNRKIVQVVDAIRTGSRIPPVILVQGDHGHGRLGRDLPPLDQVSARAMLERISVFAAYLLPGVPGDSIPDEISPVNVLRLVLRHYFRADLPPLQEATYWSGADRPYSYVRVR